MQYARQELRFSAGGWSRGTLVDGVLEGEARGVVVHPEKLTVTHTLVVISRRHPLPANATAVGDARTPTPAQAPRLSAGTKVLQGSQTVGHVTALWCDRASGQIMDFLVRPASGFLNRSGSHVLSASMVQGVGGNTIVLEGHAPALSALPLYRPDSVIEADLQQALATLLPALRARRDVKTHVQDGHVHMSGVLETDEEVQSAMRATERVSGIRGATIDLVSSESLATRVEELLATVVSEKQLTTSNLHALTEHGIVYLEGEVCDAAASATLERAARSAIGVKVVINHLGVRQ